MRVLLVSEQRPVRAMLLTVLQEVILKIGWKTVQVVAVSFIQVPRCQPTEAFDLVLVDCPLHVAAALEAVRCIEDYDPKPQMLGFVGHDKLVSQRTPEQMRLAGQCLMLSVHQHANADLYRAFLCKHIRPPETAVEEGELAQLVSMA